MTTDITPLSHMGTPAGQEAGPFLLYGSATLASSQGRYRVSHHSYRLRLSRRLRHPARGAVDVLLACLLQVEVADVIVLNKCDLVPDSKVLERTEAVLRHLNPSAKIVRAVAAKVSRQGHGRLVGVA